MVSFRHLQIGNRSKLTHTTHSSKTNTLKNPQIHNNIISFLYENKSLQLSK